MLTIGPKAAGLIVEGWNCFIFSTPRGFRVTMNADKGREVRTEFCRRPGQALEELEKEIEKYDNNPQV